MTNTRHITTIIKIILAYTLPEKLQKKKRKDCLQMNLSHFFRVSMSKNVNK